MTQDNLTKEVLKEIALGSPSFTDYNELRAEVEFLKEERWRQRNALDLAFMYLAEHDEKDVRAILEEKGDDRCC